MIEATLTIETDFVSPIQIKLQGEIIPAEVIAETTIDFGEVHIGTSISHPLMIRNPFNEPLKVQVLIGRTTLQIENELKRLKLLSITQDHNLNESRPK